MEAVRSLWVRGQPDLHSEFLDSQSHIWDPISKKNVEKLESVWKKYKLRRANPGKVNFLSQEGRCGSHTASYATKLSTLLWSIDVWCLPQALLNAPMAILRQKHGHTELLFKWGPKPGGNRRSTKWPSNWPSDDRQTDCSPRWEPHTTWIRAGAPEMKTADCIFTRKDFESRSISRDGKGRSLLGLES